MSQSSIGTALLSFKLSDKVSHELLAGIIGLVVLTAFAWWRLEGWMMVLPPLVSVAYWGTRAGLVAARAKPAA